jgi:hypothetical protein
MRFYLEGVKHFYPQFSKYIITALYATGLADEFRRIFDILKSVGQSGSGYIVYRALKGQSQGLTFIGIFYSQKPPEPPISKLREDTISHIRASLSTHEKLIYTFHSLYTTNSNRFSPTPTPGPILASSKPHPSLQPRVAVAFAAAPAGFFEGEEAFGFVAPVGFAAPAAFAETPLEAPVAAAAPLALLVFVDEFPEAAVSSPVAASSVALAVLFDAPPVAFAAVFEEAESLLAPVAAASDAELLDVASPLAAPSVALLATAAAV